MQSGVLASIKRLRNAKAEAGGQRPADTKVGVKGQQILKKTIKDQRLKIIRSPNQEFLDQCSQDLS